MVDVAVVLAFCIYAGVTLSLGHHWRPYGLQPIEYVVGAVIVVGGTWWQLELAPSADWLLTIVRFYGWAGVIVIPAEIVVAAVRRAEARRLREDLELGEEPA